MLKGCDVSHWNSNVNFNNYDFVIIKATEGKTYVDPMLDKFYDKLHGSKDGKADTEKLYGFYHYARPENNNPIDEAKHFLSKVSHHKGHCIFALDWEGTALKYPIEWALEWLRYVYKETGVRPLIYCSASYTHNLQKLYEENFGIWVAHYGVTKPKLKTYNTYAIWQYTSKPIDLDYFNGNKEQFKKYCEVRHGN